MPPDNQSTGAPVAQSPDTGKTPAAPWIRLTGAGLELAMVAIVFGAIGYAIDHLVGSERQFFAALVGLLGFALGMIRFIRLAMAVSADQRHADADGIASAMNEKTKTKDQTVTPSDQHRELN